MDFNLRLTGAKVIYLKTFAIENSANIQGIPDYDSIADASMRKYFSSPKIKRVLSGQGLLVKSPISPDEFVAIPKPKSLFLSKVHFFIFVSQSQVFSEAD